MPADAAEEQPKSQVHETEAMVNALENCFKKLQQVMRLPLTTIAASQDQLDCQPGDVCPNGARCDSSFAS